MSERTARIVLGVVGLVLCVVVTRVDLGRLSGGHFWGDGATYHAMAHSLAADGDLRYEARDVLRSRREFAAGPQGIFLKRSFGGWTFEAQDGFPWMWPRRVGADEKRIYFAKAFTYPLAAAPLVALFGTGGLLLTNALALWLAIVLAYLELRRQATPAVALLAALALVLACVAPLYLLWPTPELFTVGVIAAGLTAWRRDWPLLSAVLLGVAVYTKPSNLFVALPLGVAPLLPLWAPGFGRRFLESLRRGLVLAAAAGALYALNWAVTGEWNYQGGRERKTFYGTLPLEAHGVTFGNSGIWMSTNQVGPRVAGVHDEAKSQGAEPPRSAAEFRASYLRNLGYFWVGRFGGALPYFFPMTLALLAFLAVGPRETHGWLALAAVVVSQLFYIWLIPDNWYGGSGTLGNRYFLNLLPLAALLVPRGRELVLAGAGVLGGLALVGPMLLAPMVHARDPGRHTKSALLRLFPLEVTMLNDLAVFGDLRRKKQSYGDTEGDPQRPGSADPRAYYLYFPDDGTNFRETHAGRDGFWVRRGAAAQIVLRALEPVTRITFRVTGGAEGDRLSLRTAAGSSELSVEPGAKRQTVLPPGSWFAYKETYTYILNLRSLGSPSYADAADEQRRGSFVEIELEVEPHRLRGGDPPVGPP